VRVIGEGLYLPPGLTGGFDETVDSFDISLPGVSGGWDSGMSEVMSGLDGCGEAAVMSCVPRADVLRTVVGLDRGGREIGVTGFEMSEDDIREEGSVEE